MGRQCGTLAGNHIEGYRCPDSFEDSQALFMILSGNGYEFSPLIQAKCIYYRHDSEWPIMQTVVTLYIVILNMQLLLSVFNNINWNQDILQQQVRQNMNIMAHFYIFHIQFIKCRKEGLFMKKRLSLILVLAMAVSLIAGCGNGTKSSGTGTKISPPPATSENPDKTSSKASESEPEDLSDTEAPMLADQVASGDLPPLEKRLPASDDIMIEPDVISLGEYGDSITLQCADSGHWTFGPYSEQSMFRFEQDGSGKVEPNVCKEFTSNDDSTVWTIKLREGMRWSDGEPFTADDVIFYYDHMSTPALNEDRSAMDPESDGYYPAYTSRPYSCYQVEVDGEQYWAEFKKENDYEFTVTFAAPAPAFPENVAIDNKWMFLPRHFYINYVSRKNDVKDDPDFPFITEQEALDNANRDFKKNWESYSTMSKDIGYYHWDYHIVPQLRSFIATKDNWDTVGETYELVRNPYFWKTDKEGRQLPYLDSIKFRIINDEEQITLAASGGEFDIINPADYSTVASALKNTHSLKEWITSGWDEEGIQLNQTVKDPDKRALFQDKRFREALSICVDRNLLNKTLRNDMATPWQASVPEGAFGYDPEWSKKWTEYDADRANQLLDEITEPWDQKEGTYRKMKGMDKDVEIILSVREPSASGDFVSLLKTAYKAIGVKLSDKVDADVRTTLLTNDVESALETVGTVTPALRPDAVVPVRNVQFWYSAYGKWYEDGKTEASGGIAPEGDVLELVKAYDAIKAANGPDREDIVKENVRKIYDLHKENIWVIGYLSPRPVRNLVGNRLHNFPEGLMSADEFRYNNLARPEQWWVDDTK